MGNANRSNALNGMVVLEIIERAEAGTFGAADARFLRAMADRLATREPAASDVEDLPRKLSEANYVWVSILEAVQKAVGDRWHSATGTNHDRVLHFIGKLASERVYGGDAATFLDDVSVEIQRARAKLPDSRLTMVALGEEHGELCKAVLDESAARVYAEAVQVACMAARVVLDGDRSADEHRARHGLDAIGGGAA